nr:hypothetical protein [uncultured Holophaga sp.]
MRHPTLLTLLLCPAVMAMAAQGADPQGYRGCRWGSSLGQVKAMLAPELDSAAPTQKDGGTVLAESAEVAGLACRVSFHFERNALSKVIITAGQSGTPEQLEVFKAALTRKYGPPASDRTGRSPIGTERELRWTFPTTIITLMHHELKGGITIVGLVYQPGAPPEPNDNL